MNSAAVKAAVKAVTQNLLADFKSNLVMGALCRLDFSAEDRYIPGEKVVVSVRQPIPPPHEWKDGFPPPGVIPIDFRLEHKIYPFVIADVTELLMGNSSVTDDIRRAVEYLVDQIEAALTESLNGFVSYANGSSNIDAHLLNNLDNFLFDKSASDDGAIYIVTSHPTPQLEKLIESKPYIELFTPASQHAKLLPATVAFRRDAVGLITRGIKFQSVNKDQSTTYLDGTDIGLTIVAIPDGKSLQIEIHLLFAAGLLRAELGVKLQTAAIGNSAQPAIMSDGIDCAYGEPAQALPQIDIGPSMEDVRNQLPALMADLMIERLHTTMDSLADSIEDPVSRMRTALKLMQRADGIRPESLIDCCDRQIGRLLIERQRFTEAAEAHCAAEVDSREETLTQTAQSILEAEKHLQSLRDKSAALELEISTHLRLIDDSTTDFNQLTGLFESAAMELRAKLEGYLPKPPRANTETA